MRTKTKYPAVPKILQSVPQHLSDMTDAQWDASVKWYSKLPLKELRLRQRMASGQKEDLYKRTRKIGREMSAHETMGWNNLDILEDILTQAVMRKLPRYKSNPKRFITDSQFAELVNLFHLAKTALSGKDDSKYQRMIWASKEFHKAHPNISATYAYKDLSDAVNAIR